VHEPLLGIAWTLQYEVVFYTVFVGLIINRTFGLALLTIWLAWIVAMTFGVGGRGVPSALCGNYGLEFFLGMGAAALVNHNRVPAPLLVVGTGLALFVTAMTLDSVNALDITSIAARLAYGISATLLVAGVAAAERSGKLSVPIWLQTVGEASYSIYLFQFVFIGTMWQAWLKAGLDHGAPHILCFLTLVATALIGGLVMSRLIERPMLRLVRSQPRTKLRNPELVRS
jgi:exopolysaccharide production protein ExoZ